MHVIKRFVTTMAAVVVPMLALAACGSSAQSTTNVSWGGVLIVLGILGVVGLAYVVLKKTSQETHQYGKSSSVDDDANEWDGSDGGGD